MKTPAWAYAWLQKKAEPHPWLCFCGCADSFFKELLRLTIWKLTGHTWPKEK